MNDNIRIPIAEAIGHSGPRDRRSRYRHLRHRHLQRRPERRCTRRVSLAFGLSLLCMAYLIGRISGCHINPAVTIGMIVAKKLEAAKSAPYFIGQFVGGIVGAGIIALMLSGTDGYLSRAQDAGFASNGYGDHSPAGLRPAVGGDHRDRHHGGVRADRARHDTTKAACRTGSARSLPASV